MRKLPLFLLATLPLTAGGCTVAKIATMPIKAGAQAADWATTSQDEADRNYGRKMRKQEAKEAREKREKREREESKRRNDRRDRSDR